MHTPYQPVLNDAVTRIAAEHYQTSPEVLVCRRDDVHYEELQYKKAVYQ